MSLDIEVSPVIMEGEACHYTDLAEIIYDGYNPGMDELDIDPLRPTFDVLLKDVQVLWKGLASEDDTVVEDSVDKISGHAQHSPLLAERMGALVERFVSPINSPWTQDTPHDYHRRDEVLHAAQLFMSLGVAFRGSYEAQSQVRSCGQAVGEYTALANALWNRKDEQLQTWIEQRLRLAAIMTITSLAISPEHRTKLLEWSDIKPEDYEE